MYVLLDADQHTDQHTDQERAQDHTAELIATLREQLAAERQAHAEARRIIAGLVERIPPQIEAPRDERESPTETAADTESTEPLSSTPGPQERISRPWWRRLFGA